LKQVLDEWGVAERLRPSSHVWAVHAVGACYRARAQSIETRL